MEFINQSHLEDILSFDIAIKNMYLKLADLEYEGKTDTEEYQNIFSLLENARKIEKDKFARIFINQDAYERMTKYFSKDNEKTDILRLLENQDYIEGIRLKNTLGFIAMQNNAFITEKDLQISPYKEELKEGLINRKYRDAYEAVISRNTIYIVSEDIKKMPDDELRKYFIYLKYFNIYISPADEFYFLENLGKINPPISMKFNKYKVPEYTEEEYENCCRDNLTHDIVDDITYLFEGDDELFRTYPYKLELCRILSFNKARLISLEDKSFIILIKKTIDNLISEVKEYQSSKKYGLRRLIDQMIIESLEILDTIEEKRKLELK